MIQLLSKSKRRSNMPNFQNEREVRLQEEIDNFEVLVRELNEAVTLAQRHYARAIHRNHQLRMVYFDPGFVKRRQLE